MVKSIFISAATVGALGVAALGVGSGVANAAPVTGSGWAEHPGWGWGPRHHWGPPPPPPPYYGGVGWGPPQICATGPLHLVQTCI